MELFTLFVWLCASLIHLKYVGKCVKTQNVRIIDLEWCQILLLRYQKPQPGGIWNICSFVFFTWCKTKGLGSQKHVKALSIEHNRKVDAFVLIAASTRQVVPNVIVLESSLHYLIIWCKAKWLDGSDSCRDLFVFRDSSDLSRKC